MASSILIIPPLAKFGGIACAASPINTILLSGIIHLEGLSYTFLIYVNIIYCDGVYSIISLIG